MIVTATKYSQMIGCHVTYVTTILNGQGRNKRLPYSKSIIRLGNYWIIELPDKINLSGKKKELRNFNQ